jgi:NAD(P)-dependent dehydrogenase (short-subunit alcohol dehydrogenase family)
MGADSGLRFDEKVAIVTAADSTIGAAAAEALATHGARLVLVGHDELALHALSTALDGSGARALTLVADIHDSQTMQGVVMATVERFGALHFAVNIAAPVPPSLSPAGGVTSWGDAISADHSALFYALRVELPAIEAAGGGAVVNISSVYGEWGSPAISDTTDALSSVRNLTRLAARSWGGRGVRINELQPGLINSRPTGHASAPQEDLHRLSRSIPANRVGEPAEVASAVLFLLSEEASYISGAHLAVDGGFAA